MSNTESHWNVEYVIICNKIKSSSILESGLYYYWLYAKSSRYFGIESFRFVIIFFLFHHGHCADQYIFDFLILSCYNFIYSTINGLLNTSIISLTVSLFHLISFNFSNAITFSSWWCNVLSENRMVLKRR